MGVSLFEVFLNRMSPPHCWARPRPRVRGNLGCLLQPSPKSAHALGCASASPSIASPFVQQSLASRRAIAQCVLPQPATASNYASMCFRIRGRRITIQLRLGADNAASGTHCIEDEQKSILMGKFFNIGWHCGIKAHKAIRHEKTKFQAICSGLVVLT